MEQEDYPENFEQFITRFATEQDCYNYIVRLRWPQEFVCPCCQCGRYWYTKWSLLGLCRVWASNVNYLGNYFPRDTQATSPLVSRHVVDGLPENCFKRKEFAKYYGL